MYIIAENKMSLSRDEHRKTSSTSLKYTFSTCMRSKVVLFVVLFFSLGCVFDHLTTAYGVNLPAIVETNPMVLLLMDHGVWHWVEFCMMVTAICYGLFIIRMGFKATQGIYLTLMMATGSFRLYAGILNLAIIIKVLY